MPRTMLPVADPSLAPARRRPARRPASLLPGLALTGVVTAVAMMLADNPWLAAQGGSPLTIAIVLGVLVGNTVYGRVATPCTAGINFSKQRLLRAGIVLYGLRLTFGDIGRVGLEGIAIDAVVVCGTSALAILLGTKLLGLDRKTAMLIGAGSSICGAAAVMATGPVVRARADQVAVAIATVVVFGTIAIFLYPAAYAWNLEHQLVATSAQGFGLFIGSTVHEVAQVVAAAGPIGTDAANTAVIAKLVRVMMLAPFLVTLSALVARFPDPADGSADGAAKAGIVIPWFALGFVAVAGVNSLGVLPAGVRQALIDLDSVLLAMAMGALGLTTHLSAIRQAGLRPLVLAALLFAWLVVGGFALNVGAARLFGASVR